MSTLTRLLLLIALSVLLVWSNRTFADNEAAAANGSRPRLINKNRQPMTVHPSTGLRQTVIGYVSGDFPFVVSPSTLLRKALSNHGRKIRLGILANQDGK
ncbi:MAG: hypothetical protein KGZ83_16860 [Sulfuricella sp.]|nr:hypothetical protein [Sulfuricella sp.]